MGLIVGLIYGEGSLPVFWRPILGDLGVVFLDCPSEFVSFCFGVVGVLDYSDTDTGHTFPVLGEAG